jgi:tetratricopeptide (TPR) repeat protein
VTAEEVALALRLVAALDGLPLALDQAGAYLEETGCSLATYLALYQKAPLRLLSARTAEQPHPASVVRTFGVAYERLLQCHPGAAALAQVCAYLAPEVIPEELITEGAEQLGPAVQALVADPFQYQEAFRELLAYGLIRRQAQAGTVTMHRLVQAVVREQLGEEEQRQWAERVLRLVAAAFPAPEVAAWEQCQRLLPHALVCVGHAERWGFCFPEGARLLLLHHAGEYLRRRAQQDTALLLLQQALVLREQTLGADHLDVATILNSLAVLYRQRGQYREALPLAQRALLIREQALGPEHPQVAASLNTLSAQYSFQGQYREAQPLVERALRIWEQTLEPEQPDLARSVQRLASLYNHQGQYREARPLAERALAIREQALGEHHPATTDTRSKLQAVWRTLRAGKTVVAQEDAPREPAPTGGEGAA